MAFNVGDRVVCQKLGGQSGTKKVSPPFAGEVADILPTGYKVTFDDNRARGYFPDGQVNENHATAE